MTTVIIDYLSERLDPQRTMVFDAHLEKCRYCMAFLETYRKTIEVLRSLPSQEISPHARDRIQRSLERRLKHSSPAC
jgi:anti-sigma factor RsiW